MVHPLIGSVVEGHELQSALHGAIDAALLQNRQRDVRLQDLQRALHDRSRQRLTSMPCLQCICDNSQMTQLRHWKGLQPAAAHCNEGNLDISQRYVMRVGTEHAIRHTTDLRNSNKISGVLPRSPRPQSRVP